MKTSPAGRDVIREFEGTILGAYDDLTEHVVRPGQQVRGTLTIGTGHTSAAGPPRVYVGMTITREQADAILAADLASVEIEVTHLVKVPLTQGQFDALVSFQFNTGALRKASLLRKLNSGDYRGAADGLLAWNKAGGRVLAGLTRRRKAERAMFLGLGAASAQK